MINQEKNQRNSSIELLRIVITIGIVICHCNNPDMGGGLRFVADGSINKYYLFFTTNLFVCAVNLFVMISSYYLCVTKKRRFIKVVELIIQVIVFNLASYFLSVIIGNATFSVKGFLGSALPANYFVILYSVLYIISPYLNLLIEGLNSTKLTRFLITIFLIFSVWTFLVDILENFTGYSWVGLSTVGAYGSQYGYSIVNFILIYFVASYIRFNEISIRKGTLGILIILNLLIIFLTSLIEDKIGLSSTSTWNYNNPLVILLSALILVLVININFYSKLINELARGAFTCYLFHLGCINKLRIEDYVNKPIYVLIGYQFGVAIAIYLVSYIVYKVYRFCSRWLIILFTPLCDKINITLD